MKTMENGHPSDNCTAENLPLYTFYASVMIMEFTLALPLNLSVLYLFIFKLKFWKSKTNNIFLFNLVLADVLLIICLPVKAYHFLNGNRRSTEGGTCKAMLFMLFLNRGASIAFLTVISVDRYFNVVHPGKKNFAKALKKSPHISFLIWLLLLPLTIPTMLKSFECCNSYGREDDTLVEDVTDTLREVVFFTQILIPFFVLVYCTVRIVNRLKKKTVGDSTKLRRAVFLVTSVMLVFSFCFLPCTIARMVLLIVRVENLPKAEAIVVQVFDGLMVLSYMDCVVDPIVYCLSSTKFKSLYLTTYCRCLLSENAEIAESTISIGNNSSPKRNNNILLHSR
ncbi:12-(S)-hydroxy-5,8,10,14-eicosatetraenoic acid receptor-like [Salvelinus namaycush]|uniref:12-(S)-hydroxy-5,8,10,14-eicosatetraenoic acid receptor-like n=1 Tax=Salvelinus namaycush TaxID=8040 RepID=A0A8U0PHT9_SALNM|nr:12-(S)-hydroxy-5,8,10,14-eicosatetraenoic acid receptor-like [Salvelinus namaycush]